MTVLQSFQTSGEPLVHLILNLTTPGSDGVVLLLSMMLKWEGETFIRARHFMSCDETTEHFSGTNSPRPIGS